MGGAPRVAFCKARPGGGQHRVTAQCRYTPASVSGSALVWPLLNLHRDVDNPAAVHEPQWPEWPEQPELQLSTPRSRPSEQAFGRDRRLLSLGPPPALTFSPA